MIPPERIRVRLSFAKSTSAYYLDAVELAESLPGYRRSGEGRSLTHSVDVELPAIDTGLWDTLHKLHQIAGRWNSCNVAIEGTPFDSLSDLMRLVGDVRLCRQVRTESGLHDAYCSGKRAPDADAEVFGCRRLGAVSRAIFGPSHAEFSWWQFGALSKDRTGFAVDKRAIADLLRHRASHRICTLCPHFSWERVQRDVDQLPSEIRISATSRFELRYSEVNPEIALGIRPRIYSGVPTRFSLDLSGAIEDAIEEDAAGTVWVAPLAQSFHHQDCALAGEPRWPVSRDAAISRGLTACPLCEP